MLPSTLFFAALATVQASPSPAQEPVGTWAYVSDSGLDQAIKDCTEDMFAPMRSMASSRLKARHAPHKTIRISRAADTISVQFDEEPALRLPINGQEVHVTGHDGQKATAFMQLQSTQWVQTLRGNEGESTYTFRLEGPGQLYVQVTAKSPRLTKPLSYRIDYRKKG